MHAMEWVALADTAVSLGVDIANKGLSVDVIAKHAPELISDIGGTFLPGVGGITSQGTLATVSYTADEVALGWNILTAPAGGLP